MFFDSFQEVFVSLLFWWAVLLVFQRFPRRYPKNNPWKKDIIITFFQAIVFLIIFPLFLTYVLQITN